VLLVPVFMIIVSLVMEQLLINIWMFYVKVSAPVSALGDGRASNEIAGC
jgi:hypothetical protein